MKNRNQRLGKTLNEDLEDPCTVAGLLSLANSVVRADEYLRVYTRGADTLPKGGLEAKFRNTSRLGKHSGEYAFHDMRPALEYGVTAWLSVEFEGKKRARLCQAATDFSDCRSAPFHLRQ